MMSRLMLQSPAGQDLVLDEIVPEGHTYVAYDATGEEIDTRVEIGRLSCYHPATSCSIVQPVDGLCKVFGVQSLWRAKSRVVAASVIPVGLAARCQSLVFALAEKAAAMIIADVLCPFLTLRSRSQFGDDPHPTRDTHASLLTSL